MEQRKHRWYPSAPLENNDLEQRLEKNLNDVNSFNNHINKTKENITHFIDQNHKSKKIYKKYKTVNTILTSVDTIVIIGATSISVTLSSIGIGLIVLPISAGVAFTLPLGNKVLHKFIIKKYKKQYERDHQTTKVFDKLYRKVLQDIVFDKSEYDGLCNVFTN